MQFPCMLSVALVFGAASYGQVLEIFGDPDRACALLEPEGFAGGGWTLRPYGLQCFNTRDSRQSGRESSPPTPNGTAPIQQEPVPAGSIAYAASGDSLTRVSRLKLLVRLHTEQSNKTLLADYEDLAALLLTRIGLDMTEELRKAIQGRQPLRRILRGATLTFDPGPSPYTFLVLTVRDPRIRVVPIPRVRD